MKLSAGTSLSVIPAFRAAERASYQVDLAKLGQLGEPVFQQGDVAIFPDLKREVKLLLVPHFHEYVQAAFPGSVVELT